MDIELKSLKLKNVKKLIGVAETVADAFGQDKGDGAFSEWLRRTVGSLTVRDTALQDALAALHRHGLPLATTNYDSLLSTACKVSPVLVSEVNKATRLFQGEERGILHLHGYYDRPDSVVLGSAKYQDIVRSPFQTFLQQALAAGNSLIFVGCGGTMDDPNIARLLEWLDGTLLGAEHFHYFLCLEKDVADWRAKGWKKLLPLSFGPSHTDLPAFLNSLLLAAPPSTAPGPAPAPQAPDLSIPPPPTHFVGRKAEMETATKALLSGHHVCVMGTGGIGKTGLTKRIAHDPAIAAACPRRLFVRLEGATTGHDAALKVAEALGMPPSPHILGPLKQELAQQPTLLILDNAETPRDADPAGMEDFLSHAGQAAKILLSIRGQLAPTGLEWRRALLSRLGNDDTRRLFLGIAGDHLSTDPHLPNLLAKTDGIPLAIRLLAAQAEGQNSLRDLWTEWQTVRARLLETDGRTDKDGNFTASVMLSLNSPKLTSEGKRLLSLLGQLPDGLAPAMRDDLLGPAAPSAQRNLLHLALAQEEKGRLRLLVPVREVVAVKLPPSAEKANALAAHMMALAADGDDVGTSDGRAAVDRLMPEFGNIITVLEKQLSDRPSGDLIRAITHLGEFQRFTGHGSTALLSCATENARNLNDLSLQAACTFQLGAIALERSSYREAERQFQQALQLFQRTANVLKEAQCIQRLGDIALYQSSYEKARQRYNQALPIFRRSGFMLGEAHCIKGLGGAALRRSLYKEAREHYEKALPIFQFGGDVLGEANCIKGLGDIALECSFYEVAADRYRQALPLYRCVGALLGEANCIKGLGSKPAHIIEIAV
ncbi:tetratricopeptide repeat protein [Niveispirillum cyanobacteriorum]|uniref:tetratricopeptide repeat protein n=1 Tax=Niveispirillum cyanobacteriorum TaxID=1612173 RepID=UPI001319D0BE|nr:tetratricopeptide repeat protein [Niveispirillum cyanobacteriorum]